MANPYESNDQVEKVDKGITSRALESNAARYEDISLQTDQSNTLRSQNLKPETKTALQQEAQKDPRVLNGNEIMKDDTGHAAENYARVVLQNEGLPQDGKRRALSGVVEVKIDKSNHGIDLVGAENGKPIMMEVKKRNRGDAIGEGRINEDGLLEETKKLREQIRFEQECLPDRVKRYDSLTEQANDKLKGHPGHADDYNEELSTLQMGGLWARDRWLRAIKDPASADELRKAGISEEYLKLENYKDAYSKQWRDVLDNRCVIFVTHARDTSSPSTMGDAIFRRKASTYNLSVGDHY